MSALALDLGLQTGWAFSDGGNGTWAPTDPADHGRSLAEFSDWIEWVLDTYYPTLLAIEKSVTRTVAAPSSRLTLLFEGTAHMHAYTRCIQRTERSADQVRLWLLGFARISKAHEPSKAARTREMDKLVLAAVRARGFDPSTEHAADACALLCCVEQRMPREVAA